MGFRNQPFACESPKAAVELMVARVQAHATTRAPERLPLAQARGRVLAESIRADRSSPPFDTSAMDGYAVRRGDLAAATMGDLTLEVAGEVRIGDAPGALPAGKALRIVTGAAIPPGCDAVLKREDLVEHEVDRAIRTITIAAQNRAKARAGDHIRRRGENACEGAELLTVGTPITAAAIGALAAVGCAHPLVHARVRVAIITTGDEVVAPGEVPSPFQIRNSNGPAVEAVLNAHAFIEVTMITHVRDEEDALAIALRVALASADAVILTGGISMGHRDGVRSAVDAVGAEVLFHGLPQRPGKPMLGAVVGNIPIFALPGNPVSAMVTCTRIALPVLAARAGIVRAMPIAQLGLANPDGKSLEIWWHRLVRIDAQGEAQLADGRGSGDMMAAGMTDGFIEVPPGAAEYERFAFYPWST